MPFCENAPSGNMFHLEAKDVMARPVICVTQTVRVRDVVAVLTSCSHNGFPVVADSSPHQFTGMVLRNQLAVLLKRRAFGPGELSLARVHYDDFATSLQSKHVSFDPQTDVDPADYDAIIDLRPFYNPVPISVQQRCPLSRVFVLFRSLGVRHLYVFDVEAMVAYECVNRKESQCKKGISSRCLPVLHVRNVLRRIICCRTITNRNNEVVGIISRKEIMSSFDQDLF